MSRVLVYACNECGNEWPGDWSEARRMGWTTVRGSTFTAPGCGTSRVAAEHYCPKHRKVAAASRVTP